jgi:hypothetical protein
VAVSSGASVDELTCAQCGAPTLFAPGRDALVCEHCGETKVITLASGAIPTYDLFGPTAAAALAAAAEVHAARVVECKLCGARAIVSHQAERCAFCDTPMVIEVDDKTPGIPPGGVHTFTLDRKAATANFATWLRKRWFAPGDLMKRAERGHVDGVYLPHWVFDTESTTSYRGQRGTTRYRTETYTDSDGKEQTREVSYTDWWNTSGVVNVTCDDVLAAGSQSLPKKLTAKLQPWQLGSLRPFDARYLAGFVAERYRVEASDGFVEATTDVIEPVIRKAIRADIGGDDQRIDDMAIQWDSVRFRHVLLPLWLSTFRYRDRAFHVAVNAVTGEVVGERPWSALKIALLVVVLAAAITAIALYFAH